MEEEEDGGKGNIWRRKIERKVEEKEEKEEEKLIKRKKEEK